MRKNTDAKYRRKFYSLYLDTITVLILFGLLVLVVWLSMRSMPLLKAQQMKEAAAALTKEKKQALQSGFVVNYVKADELGIEKSPEIIAFGNDLNSGIHRVPVHLLRSSVGSSFSVPKYEIKKSDFSGLSVAADSSATNSLFVIQKPELSLEQMLNFAGSKNAADSSGLKKKFTPNVFWTLPDEIQERAMPKLEPLMNKYGWLSGSIDIKLIVGEKGFVSNAIICSEDTVDANLVRELKSKLLQLHLGAKNANRVYSISVSWDFSMM